MIFIYF